MFQRVDTAAMVNPEAYAAKPTYRKVRAPYAGA
jgi:hypothetical protein